MYLDEPGWVALVHDWNTTTYLRGDQVPASRKRAVPSEFEIARPPCVLARMRRAKRLGRRLARGGVERILRRR
jgi:hypothetical protein